MFLSRKDKAKSPSEPDRAEHMHKEICCSRHMEITPAKLNTWDLSVLPPIQQNFLLFVLL